MRKFLSLNLILAVFFQGCIGYIQSGYDGGGYVTTANCTPVSRLYNGRFYWEYFCHQIYVPAPQPVVIIGGGGGHKKNYRHNVRPGYQHKHKGDWKKQPRRHYYLNDAESMLYDEMFPLLAPSTCE